MQPIFSTTVAYLEESIALNDQFIEQLEAMRVESWEEPIKALMVNQFKQVGLLTKARLDTVVEGEKMVASGRKWL